MKRALITGITGQDGSYLAELLLSKGYEEVHGLIRRSSSINTARLSGVYREPQDKSRRLFLHYGDMTDPISLMSIFQIANPDEVYNLAAQSHVRVSFDIPDYTTQVNALGAVRLMEIARQLKPMVRFYQASSSEMFGNETSRYQLVGGTILYQDENTLMVPISPYACAKLHAYRMAQMYRKAYGMFIANGILFNHESPRRGETFLTRKVTMAVAKIKAGLQKHLYLGHLSPQRDWGYAPEYVEAMWLMLQANNPDDYVVASEEAHSVGEFVEEAFSLAGLDWKKHVREDPKYLRSLDVQLLRGAPGKARVALKWQAKTKFKELVKLMVDADMAALKKEPVHA